MYANCIPNTVNVINQIPCTSAPSMSLSLLITFKYETLHCIKSLGKSVAYTKCLFSSTTK